MGAGIDPTSGLGAGLGSLDPSSVFGGLGGLGGFDPLGGLGSGIGAIGSSSSSPGGNISEVASAEGDPTGALQAQQSIQAGAPTPGTPGGGIGGAQSGVPSQQPTGAPPVTQAGYKVGPTTGQPMDSSQPSDPSQTSTQAKTQYGPPMQPPTNFDQRYTGEAPANFAQRFGQANMAPGGNMASTLPQLSQTQLAQAGTNFPEAQPGLAGLTGGGAGAPNVDTPVAGPATPTTTGGAAGAAPSTADTTGADTGAKTAATGAGTAKTADTTDASSGADRQAPGGQGGGGRGGPGGGMPNINPLALISALLRGGPLGALSELAREAQGQGMMNPSMPGGGAPGRGYSGGGTGRPGEEEAPETPAPDATTPQTPEQAQAAQAAAAGQEAPGVRPTSTGFEPGQPGQPGPTGALPAPPAWAQQVAAGGAPNVNANQNASLGTGNLTSTGQAGGGAPGTVGSVPQGGYNTPVQGTNYHGGLATAQAHANNFGQPLDQNLYRDRERYRQELIQKPWLREKALRIMYNEQGRNAQGTQSIMETAMNRASVRGTSLEQSLRWHRAEPGGYYQIGNKGVGMAPYREVLQRSFNNALNGSNLSNYATDNSSGGLAQREARTGAFNRRQGYTGETFFAPGRAEPGFARNWQSWHANMRGGQAPVMRAQRAGEGSPAGSLAPGSMGRGSLEPAGGWSRRSFEDVNNPTFGERFEGDTPRDEARIRKANYEAMLPSYTAPPSQMANALGLGDIRLDQITQLLSQLQASPPQ